MSKQIREAYKKANVPIEESAPQGGKGVHTLAAHKCVINYLKQGIERQEAWKRCVGGMGADNAIKPAHQRS